MFITPLLVGCEKETPDISGGVSYFSGCKDFKHSLTEAAIPDTLSCIFYSFNTRGNVLSIEHINAAFNCCPGTISCEVRQHNDTLVIEEFEEARQCDCTCLYDITVVIRSLEARKYYIEIIEPYIGEKERIAFEVDLRQNQTGSYCLTRDRYPWGMKSGQ